MARIVGPIAEQNPFLTSATHVPATALSEKLGLSPGTQCKPGENQDGERSQYSEESEHSEESSESEHKVDESVLEEMAKLGKTFDEIGLKFRMIDRIGEGALLHGTI